MTVYIDINFKCHAENGDGRVAVETDFFEGKCPEFIEGYRFVPAGETWTREDGVEFAGKMIAPFVDYAALDAAQREYERQQLADMRAALELLGVTTDE